MLLHRNFIKVSIFMAAMVLLLAACNLGELPPTQDPGAIFTQAAQTVVAQLTQDAAIPNQDAIGTSVAQTIIADLTANAPTATHTPPPPTPTETLPPTFTPTATNTLIPTATWTASPTVDPRPCDAASFVADVTIPDGTVMTPGTSFTKIWRIRNVGICNWTNQYSLVFTSGERMDSSFREYALPGTVRPGETIDLEIDFVAPSISGNYRSNWMLRNASGRNFGVGRIYDSPFWVSIRVTAPNPDFAYDFVANACSAEWRSRDNASLPCPGAIGDSKGYVRIQARPELEDGRLENEPALLTVPNDTSDGFIRGTFRNIRIRDGNRFRSGIGCEYDAKNCDVFFFVSYRAPGGQIVELGSWREVYDGQWQVIDIDLSFLAGQTIDLFLEVQANGRTRANFAQWWVPHITK
jgi:hypothetical protein